MIKHRRAWIVAGTAVLLVTALLIIGRTPIKIVFAALQPTDHFVAFADEPRVLFEPGAETLANAVAQALPDAVSAVETRQYLPFSEPVTVYVCESLESFARYSPVKQAGGIVVNNRLFISPKLEATPQRIAGIVTHELSHLHLRQHIGSAWSIPPAWFLEGLAVDVSAGGGAERVSEAQAIEAILRGAHFTPEPKGGVFFRKSGSSYGLTPHMFYRQSALFITFLRERHAEEFKMLIVKLAQGVAFDEAFVSAYGMPPQELWGDFLRNFNGEQRALRGEF